VTKKRPHSGPPNRERLKGMESGFMFPLLMNLNVGQASRLPSERMGASSASASPTRAGETPALCCWHPRVRGPGREIPFRGILTHEPARGCPSRSTPDGRGDAKSLDLDEFVAAAAGTAARRRFRGATCETLVREILPPSNGRGSFCLASAGSCGAAKAKDRQNHLLTDKASPSPGGEGRGEGERSSLNSAFVSTIV